MTAQYIVEETLRRNIADRNDSGISEARDRLRNKARNEQTSVGLNNLLRLAEEEILRLKEENERLRKDAAIDAARGGK